MEIPNFTITFGLVLFVGVNWYMCHVEAMENHISNVVHRQMRALTYPEDSEMGMFFALAVPLDDPISTKSLSVAFFYEVTYELPTNITDFYPESEAESRSERRGKRSMDRRTAYSILESKFESIGFPGQQCLLRSICETASNPIHHNNGFLGDLMHIILTPSSSVDEGLPVEYAIAEEAGRGAECGKAYPLCPFGIYDYITTVYE